jgi:hypothetical protein
MSVKILSDEVMPRRAIFSYVLLMAMAIAVGHTPIPRSGPKAFLLIDLPSISCQRLDRTN